MLSWVGILQDYMESYFRVAKSENSNSISVKKSRGGSSSVISAGNVQLVPSVNSYESSRSHTPSNDEDRDRESLRDKDSLILRPSIYHNSSALNLAAPNSPTCNIPLANDSILDRGKKNISNKIAKIQAKYASKSGNDKGSFDKSKDRSSVNSSGSGNAKFASNFRKKDQKEEKSL